MLPRERVITVIRHGVPDRIPIYGWLKANLSEQISAEFGSVEAFEDYYEFDLAHIFGGPEPFPREKLAQLRQACGGEIEPAQLLELPLNDPDDMSCYEPIRKQIAYHKEGRGRFVYGQTPGIFECLNSAFGIQNHLMYLALYEDELREVYRRQAEWNRRFANNCMDLGIDMVHVSDDWGAQNSLLFSPDTWWRLMYPAHKVVADLVKARGCYLSLHSCGCVRQVLDGIVKLGFDVVHPWQESAGMDYRDYLTNYRQHFSIMGGLDVQTTLGFGKIDRLRSEIERVMHLFADGGLIFCTSHFVQNHCSMEELKTAFDLIREYSRAAVR